MGFRFKDSYKGSEAIESNHMLDGRNPSSGVTQHLRPLSEKVRSGFTLAEVLITLGIIGIVAAMTLPTLMQKQQEKSTVTALKKFYSSISQAYLYAKNENGTPDSWYGGEMLLGQQQGANIMVDKITQHMKITKKCYAKQGCFSDENYKKIDGKNTGNWDKSIGTSKFITSDGMSVFMYSYGSTPKDNGGGMQKESYGAISVDINGFKKPNIFGQDMFSFILTKEGIYPYGTPSSMQDEYLDDGTIIRGNGFPRSCNRNDCYGNCEACAAWVIYNENMDYLHCNDLSWDGKKKCN